MYLSKFSLEHFRKFNKENSVCFAYNKGNSDYLLNSTLLVGQNNAGKTTVISALDKCCKNNFDINDFNFYYLKSVLDNFCKNKTRIEEVFNLKEEDISKEKIDKDQKQNIEATEIKSGDRSENQIENIEDIEKEKKDLINQICPFMKFGFEFTINSGENSENELLTNIAPLIKNDILSDSDETNKKAIIRVFIKYEIKETIKFIGDFCKAFSQKEADNDKFNDFLSFLSKGNIFELNIYNDERCIDKVEKFKLGDLLKVNIISFEKLHNTECLTTIFNSIYKNKVKYNLEIKNLFDNKVAKINETIDNDIPTNQELSSRINTITASILDRNKASMGLKSNLNTDLLLNKVIKYFYKDGDFEIPENQFGMGYTNLMLIIAEIVDYVDNSPEAIFRNSINIIVLEEPESYMHPQMQRLFIKHINEAVKTLVDNKKININCQIIITSHSPNILYGKLEVEDTFNNINCIMRIDNIISEIIPLNDGLITNVADNKASEQENNEKLKNDQFVFLKRHIKFNCCDLFFADACIVVEGYSEETILPFYLEKDVKLNKKYISLFNINGAYAHIYTNLFKSIKIPVVIITDIDIKEPKYSNKQITEIQNKETTNNTLKRFDFKIGENFEKQVNNIKIVTQNKIEGYYPTSFEETLILENFDNEILKKTLSEIIPGTFKKYKNKVKDNSHILLNSLSGKKGIFSTLYLYKIINESDNNKLPKLPSYIKRALEYLAEELNKDNDEEMEERNG